VFFSKEKRNNRAFQEQAQKDLEIHQQQMNDINNFNNYNNNYFF